MRLLLIALADSVHIARWVSQLRGWGWDLHLFPAVWPCTVHPDLRDVTLHGVGLWRPAGLDPSVRVAGLWPWRRGAYAAARFAARFTAGPAARAAALARTIRRLKPDLVHSIEMQRAAYLTLEARELHGAGFPPWIYSCWGNDIYHFRHSPAHVPRIRAVLAACDFLTADCRRDGALAREWGFRGEDLGVFPGPGGFDLDGMLRLRAPPPVAARRVVAVKGYQSEEWGGRALAALQAVHRCADALRGHEVVVHSTTESVRSVAQHMRAVTGLDIRVLERGPHEAIVSLLGRARVSVGLSVSDGIPNTMLEAMAMGAFPVQSDTGSTAEWIDHGVNGLLVPPEDSAATEAALRRALADDALVDAAAVENARRTRARIDKAVVVPRVRAMYERAAGGRDHGA
jgi:hypothetical protein